MNWAYIIGGSLVLLSIFWPFGRRGAAAAYSSDPLTWPCTIRCVRKRKINGRWVKVGGFTVSAENNEAAIRVAAANYEALRAIDAIDGRGKAR